MGLCAVFFDQANFDVKCEWGQAGIEALRQVSDVFVIVDVLSFSTCVDIATSRGAVVYPYPRGDEAARLYAEAIGAVAASPRRTQESGYSLSPVSLLNIPAGTRLVLPSPNGSTLTLSTGELPTLAGCLRNAPAVARAAGELGRRITIIPAGERWPDGSLRFSVEDLLGAGAIISHLRGARSPEAEVATAAFDKVQGNLAHALEQCASGRELRARDFVQDVTLASQLAASDCAPFLHDDAYTRYT